MGHSPSRSNGAGDPLPSRFARFRRRLRLHHRRRRRSGDDSASAKAIAADEFAGIARIRILKVCCCFVGSLLFFLIFGSLLCFPGSAPLGGIRTWISFASLFDLLLSCV